MRKALVIKRANDCGPASVVSEFLIGQFPPQKSWKSTDPQAEARHAALALKQRDPASVYEVYVLDSTATNEVSIKPHVP